MVVGSIYWNNIFGGHFWTILMFYFTYFFNILSYFFFKIFILKKYLFIWLLWVLVPTPQLLSSCVCRLSCFVAKVRTRGILLPLLQTEPASRPLEGGFLTNRPAGKSYLMHVFFNFAIPYFLEKYSRRCTHRLCTIHGFSPWRCLE